MFKKTTVTIAIANDSFARVAMRCFENNGDHLLILGEEHDDHDVWQVCGTRIELIGTLKTASLKRAHDTDLSKKVQLNPGDFQFLQPHYADFSFEGKRVSMKCLHGTFTYHEVCKCGKHMDEPVEPCACKLKVPLLALA